MSCAFDKEMLTGYFDGELGQSERSEVEKHISACSECLRELGEIKSAAGLVRTLPRLKAPASIAEGVRREVGSRGRVHSLGKYRRSIFWTFSAAAALLVVATLSFFSALPEKRATEMAERAPQPELDVVAKANPKTAEPEGLDIRKNPALEESAKSEVDGLRRRGAEPSGREFKDAVAKEGKADRPPGLAFGAANAPDKEKLKDGSQEPGNRALPQEQSAARAAPPAPAPAASAAPAAPPPEPLSKKKLSEDKPTAPAASPKADLAKSDSKRDTILEPRDADKAAGRMEMQQAKQAAVGTSSFTVDAPQMASTRQKARELLAKWNIPDANAAAAQGKGSGPDPFILSVDLTPSQFAELKKQLEVQSGARFVSGIPVATLRNAGQGTGGNALAGGVGGKPGEDPKAQAQQPTARGVASAPVKGAEAQPAAQGPAGEERKDRQAAEKANNSKEAGASGAVQAQSGAEARQKFILYFREVPSEK